VPPRALRRQAAAVPLVAAVVPQPENLHTAAPSRALALARRCRSATGVRHHGLETRSPPSAGVSFLCIDRVYSSPEQADASKGISTPSCSPLACLQHHHSFRLLLSLFSFPAASHHTPLPVSSLSARTCFNVRPSFSPSCQHANSHCSISAASSVFTDPSRSIKDGR
jgi:hypothetical protein